MSNFTIPSIDLSKFTLSSFGKVNYEPVRDNKKFSNEKICVIDVDEDLASLYRYFWNKFNPSKPIVKPSWKSHISIMRGSRILNNETPWKYKDGEIVEFRYSPLICHDDNYVWMDTFCETFFELRQLYNVPIRYNIGHITIGKFRF